jgi:1-acyl-sn-glycerol-3-phosphate acyltransferase
MSKQTFLHLLRTVGRFLVRCIARIQILNPERLPATGACIVVTNHLGRLDAILAIMLANREDLVVFIAEKYQRSAIWRYAVRKLDAVWLNRFEADFHAMRTVLKRLQQGEMLGMAPEGTRSQSGALAEGKPGAAYLAIKANAPLIPVAITGTEDRVVLARLRRLRRADITIRVGEPFSLPPRGRQDRDAHLQQCTDEIMCQIAALLPPSYRGVYADHPRLRALTE